MRAQTLSCYLKASRAKAGLEVGKVVDTMQRPLRRELTFISATAIVVANMIGTGIFTTTGFLAGDLGRPVLVVGV